MSSSLSTAACKERGFSVQSSRMSDAINSLEEAVSGLDSAFAPVLTPEPTQGMCKNEKACESPSEYSMAMSNYIARIRDAADRVRNICRRSEI